MAQDNWNADDVRSALMQESQVMGETHAEQCKRIFLEGGPVAAAQIVFLANNADDEKLRFACAKYITERVVGPVGTEMADDGILEKLLYTFNNQTKQKADHNG